MPFEYTDSAFDTAELEEIMKEDQNGVSFDPNNCENNEDLLAATANNSKNGVWNMPKLEATMEGNDFINGNEIEPDDSVVPCTIPSGKMELFEKEIDLYTEKNVMQCELPELIVYYEENTCHVVKDICIDEGVPFNDKILIESDNNKDLCTILVPKENKNASMAEEREDIELLSSNGSTPSSKDDYSGDDFHECGSIEEEVGKKLIITDALKSTLENHSDNEISKDGESLLPVQTSEANYSSTDKAVDDVSRERFLLSSEQKSLGSLFVSPVCDSNKVEQQSDQIPCPEVSATEELNKRNPVNGTPYNSKVETATITFDFNSSESATSGRDENPKNLVPEQAFKVDNEPRHEVGVSNNNLAVGSEFQYGPGEASFSMAGLITYSGPVAHSGSISHRSDSSTTSNRSFAFPILPNEWNSSPVRMTKADGRHRKHRGWRQGLLCCRF